MKAKDFVLIALFIAGFAFLYVTTKKEMSLYTDHKLDSLYHSHQVLYNLDSIERRITEKIVDSLTHKIDSVKRDLKNIRATNERLHKQNEELIQKYKAIQVARPDF